MREILFKAKRIDNGEWAEGDLVRSYLKIGNDCITDFAKGIVYGVDNDTICQYTGLYDSTKWEDLSEKEQRAFLDEGNLPHEWKGKKIWENDVIRYVDEDLAVDGIVRFGRHEQIVMLELGFYVDWVSEGTEYFKTDICYWVEKRNIEVIGNIFDNAELLKGSENDG